MLYFNFIKSDIISVSIIIITLLIIDGNFLPKTLRPKELAQDEFTPCAVLLHGDNPTLLSLYPCHRSFFIPGNTYQCSILNVAIIFIIHS